MNPSSSENQRVIHDVGEKMDALDSQKPRAPFDWRWWAGLSAFFLALSVFAATVIFGFILRTDQREDREDRKRNEDVETCARRYATRVTNAQVDNNVSLNNLVVYLGGEIRDEVTAAQLIASLEGSTRELERVRDERLEYEHDLTLPCPIEPLVPSN